MGGGYKSQQSAIYPLALRRAICRGMMKQKLKDRENMIELLDEQHGWAQDDLTQMPLNPTEVSKARQEEMGFVADMGVWGVIDRQEATKQGLNILRTRWIDINKGDDEKPNYRSRRIAK